MLFASAKLALQSLWSYLIQQAELLSAAMDMTHGITSNVKSKRSLPDAAALP